MISAKLTWTIQCKDCDKDLQFSFETDWFSGWTCREDLSGENAIYEAGEKGWNFERLTYEELAPYCPDCKGK